MDQAIGEYLAEKREVSRDGRERREFEQWKRSREKRACN
jgi:hypothetical protein